MPKCAALDQPEQDFWLRKAEELSWSRNELRREIRSSLRERSEALAVPAPGTALELIESSANDQQGDNYSVITVDIQLKLTPHQLANFTAAANKQEQDFEEWAVHVLKATARVLARIIGRSSRTVSLSVHAFGDFRSTECRDRQDSASTGS